MTDREKRKAEFEKLNKKYSELSDNDYWKVMEEHGFSVEEIVDLSDDEE